MASNEIITKKGRENLVKARAGDITLPKIVGMAFGDGGARSNGEIIPPEESQSSLKNELLRKQVSKHTFPTPTTCRYECTLSKSELVGKEISEFGLYDQNGDLVCIKSCKKKGKDEDMEMTFVIDDIF